MLAGDGDDAGAVGVPDGGAREGGVRRADAECALSWVRSEKRLRALPAVVRSAHLPWKRNQSSAENALGTTFLKSAGSPLVPPFSSK